MSDSPVGDFPSPLVHKNILIDSLTMWNQCIQNRELSDIQSRKSVLLFVWEMIAVVCFVLVIVNWFVFVNVDGNFSETLAIYCVIPCALINVFVILGIYTSSKNTKKERPDTDEKRIVRVLLKAIETHENELAFLGQWWFRLPLEEREYRAERLQYLRLYIYAVSVHFLRVAGDGDAKVPNAFQDVREYVVVLQHFTTSYTCESSGVVVKAENCVSEVGQC